MSTPNPTSRPVAYIFRWVFVTVAAVVFLSMGIAGYKAYQASENRPTKERLFDDSVKESLPIRLDASRNVFQIGLLLAGGLWALYIGKSEETKVDLTETPELILFLLCNACFLISFSSHYAYTDRLADWINSGVPKGDKILIPEIDDERLMKLLTFQVWFFRLGCVLAVFTFLSGRYLRSAVMKAKLIPGLVALTTLMFPIPFGRAAHGQEFEEGGSLDRARQVLVAAAVSPGVLERDYRLIVDALPELANTMERNGYPRRDAGKGAASAWLALRYPRQERPSDRMRENIRNFSLADNDGRRQALIVTLSVMGKLTVSSTPDGASVAVDGIPLADPTDTSYFVDEGSHSITVSKKGYSANVGMVTVTRRREATYKVTLSP